MELYCVNDGYHRHECLTRKVDSNTFYTKHWVCFSICIFLHIMWNIFSVLSWENKEGRGVSIKILGE